MDVTPTYQPATLVGLLIYVHPYSDAALELVERKEVEKYSEEKEGKGDEKKSYIKHSALENRCELGTSTRQEVENVSLKIFCARFRFRHSVRNKSNLMGQNINKIYEATPVNLMVVKQKSNSSVTH